MMNYSDGWRKAIAATNAKISADQDAHAEPEPASKNEPPAVLDERERCAAIAGACSAAGMLEHASTYFNDRRVLDEILKEIKSAHLVTDFASHLGVKSEFRMKAH